MGLAMREPRPDVLKQTTGQRQFERITLESEVTLHSDDNFFRGFTENISEGGIFVTTHDLKPIGAIVEVQFTLPGEEEQPIKVSGEVRWVREYDSLQSHVDPGMGLRFRGLTGADRQRIEHFIQKRDPLFFDDED